MDKLKELWSHPRYKALMKLGGWLLFIACIFIISVISPKKDDNVTFTSFKSLDVMQENLLLGNYKYQIDLNIDGIITKYNGFLKGEVNEGYYESTDEIYKYSCNIEFCYKVFADHQEEMVHEFPELTMPSYIFDLIKSVEAEVKEDKEIKTYTYNLLMNNLETKIVIETSFEDIIKISIKNDTNDVTLNFTDIKKD